LVDADLPREGIAVGDRVFYNARDATDPQSAVVAEGVVDAVEQSTFTVRFADTLDQDPFTEQFEGRIERGGTLQHHLTAFLDGLQGMMNAEPGQPTLQSFVRDLAALTGVDVDDIGATSVGTGDDRVLQFTATFDPSPMTFSVPLNLGLDIPDLDLQNT